MADENQTTQTSATQQKAADKKKAASKQAAKKVPLQHGIFQRWLLKMQLRFRGPLKIKMVEIQLRLRILPRWLASKKSKIGDLVTC